LPTIGIVGSYVGADSGLASRKSDRGRESQGSREKMRGRSSKAPNF